MRRNDPERAVEYFRAAVDLNPEQPSAIRGLADAWLRAGNRDQAEIARHRFLELSPDARALANAESLHNQAESAKAERICEDLIKQDPGNMDALRLLAVIATDDDRHVVAEGLLRRIAKFSPSAYRAQLDLARFLAERSRIPEAIEILEETARIETENVEVHQNLGDMLAIVGRTSEALREYETCLDKSPNAPMAWLGRGHMKRIGGSRDEAIDSYRQCIAQRPDLGDAWWSLASLHGYELSDSDFETMSSTVESGDLSPQSEIGFRFAAARYLEQRGEFEAAWENYSLANRAKRALVKYDPVETEVLHGKLQNVFTTEIFEEKKATTPKDRTPIFILGMPRSGSTLIEQILASHSMVEGGGELPYIIMMTKAFGTNAVEIDRYPELVEEFSPTDRTGLGRSYLHHARTHCREEKPHYTDKMPCQFFACRLYQTYPAACENYRCATASAGDLRRQLPATVRAGEKPVLRPDRTWRILFTVRGNHGSLGQGHAGRCPACAV